MSEICTQLARLLLVFVIGSTSAIVYAEDWLYTIRPGDSLWKISQTYLLDIGYMQRLQAHNRLTSPDDLVPGTRLHIPVDWLQLQPAAVSARVVQGQVEFRRAGLWQVLIQGTELHAGDRIRTGVDSSLTLGFADGSELLIHAETELELDAISSYGNTGMVDTRLRLQRGRLENRVEPSEGAGSRYQITTPTAVSSVRGTEFRSAADDQAVARTEVLTGQVAVSARNRTRLINAGFGTLVSSGQAPIPPVRLLPAPATETLPAVYERSPLPLLLPPFATGATAYRVQIAPTAAFETLLFNRLTSNLELRGPDLADGNYVLRLRAISEQGLEGLDAIHPFELNARPEPPVLLAPAESSTVPEENPIFNWATPVGGLFERVRYRLQLADNEAFENPLLAISDYGETEYISEQALPSGTYYWRVAISNADGDGPFSDPLSFRRPVPSPNVEPPVADENNITLRWSEGLPGERYRFQFTNDWRFQNLLLDTTVEEPQITLVRPESGLYYLRIQVIESDGFAGPPGPIQQVNVPPASYLPLLVPLLVPLL